MSRTAWNPTPDVTPRWLMKHRLLATRGLVALVQLHQVEDTQQAANAQFRWLCDMPLDELQSYVDSLEGEVRKAGKECFGAELAGAMQAQLKLGRAA